MEPRKGLQSITTKYISKEEPGPDWAPLDNKGYTVLDDPANPTIYLRDRNSNTHIHELYHAIYSPQGSTRSLDTRVQEEVNAELLVRQTKDKGLSMNTLRRIGYAEIRQGVRPNEVFSAIVNALGEQGIVLSKSLRSNLWQGLMQSYKQRKV